MYNNLSPKATVNKLWLLFQNISTLHPYKNRMAIIQFVIGMNLHERTGEI